MSNLYGVYNKSMRFDGDIIITDPCYIMRKQNWDWNDCPNWWDFLSKTTSEEVYREDGTHYTKYNYPKPEAYPDCRPKQVTDYSDDETGKLLFKLEVLLEPEKPRMHSDTLESEYKAYREAETKWKNDHKDDWEICEYGQNMKVLGISNSMVTSTVYGDWSCTTFDSDTKKPIGSFCADAGLVAVFLLDEVLKYNPNYNDHLRVDEKLGFPWPVTVIKDFHGNVTITKRNDTVRVIGKGNINFTTSQTGL